MLVLVVEVEVLFNFVVVLFNTNAEKDFIDIFSTYLLMLLRRKVLYVHVLLRDAVFVCTKISSL